MQSLFIRNGEGREQITYIDRQIYFHRNNMVKARKNNRNRRAVAVKQKAPRDIHRKFFKPNFEKKEIQQHWNNKLTEAENLEAIGVLSNANDVQKKTKSSRSNGEKKPIDSMKVADIVDLNQKLSASRPNQSKHGMKMTDDEQAYLEPLYLKYGDKLMKMVRDHKLNYKQWTKNQLNRRLKRYKLINGL